MALVMKSCTTRLSGVRCQMPSQVLEEVPEGGCLRAPEQVFRVHLTVQAPASEGDWAAGHPYHYPLDSGSIWKAGLALPAALCAAAASLGKEKLPPY